MLDSQKEFLRKLGFTKELERHEQGLCPFCGEEVNKDDFRDKISLKEFEISGLCQKCQDITFREDEHGLKGTESL
jgi:transcription initiation factor IIE alpha subunit